MLRQQTADGWWLITHPDHARLAGAFACHWGNDMFATPQPRESVLFGIQVHDDGWTARDAHPAVTREGKPAAFSDELVGKYSAFEEIDLVDYLAVRERAVAQVVPQNAYAALLVSMHTVNLLTERADRSTMKQEQLPLLDHFLDRQRAVQERLRAAVRSDSQYTPAEVSGNAFDDNFRLLQAADNLSLLSCVAYTLPATLLHPLRLADAGVAEVRVTAVGERSFRLDPYPFDTPELRFHLPARFVAGTRFNTSEVLEEIFATAPVQHLTITLTAG